MPKSVDPLAAAKVPVPGAEAEPKAEPKPAAEKKGPKKRSHASPKVAAAPVKVPATRHVVQRKVTVSWGSQMLTLHPGKVISDDSYGEGAVEKLRNMGVALEPEGS